MVYLLIIFGLFLAFMTIGIKAQNDSFRTVYMFLAGLFLGMNVIAMALDMAGKL